MAKLKDLVEFRFDHQLKKFVKVATHKTNVPSAIAYSEKKKIEMLNPRSLITRFRVVDNGTFQYTNQFKSKKKLKAATT